MILDDRRRSRHHGDVLHVVVMVLRVAVADTINLLLQNGVDGLTCSANGREMHLNHVRESLMLLFGYIYNFGLPYKNVKSCQYFKNAVFSVLFFFLQ